MADQVHLVDVTVENLEREIHRPFFLAVFQDLVDRVDQQLLGLFALGVARVLAGDDAHDFGAEVVGLVDAVLHRTDGAAALIGVKGIEVELVAEDARLRGVGHRQMRLVEQRAAGVAHAVILHPADFDRGPEIVGADFLQRLRERTLAGLKAWEGFEVHHPHPHFLVHADRHRFLSLAAPNRVSISAAFVTIPQIDAHACHSAACAAMPASCFSLARIAISTFSGVAGRSVMRTPTAS